MAEDALKAHAGFVTSAHRALMESDASKKSFRPAVERTPHRFAGPTPVPDVATSRRRASDALGQSNRARALGVDRTQIDQIGRVRLAVLRRGHRY
jgi:hypothetical protein